jgi:hypothetical protein
MVWSRKTVDWLTILTHRIWLSVFTLKLVWNIIPDVPICHGSVIPCGLPWRQCPRLQNFFRRLVILSESFQANVGVATSIRLWPSPSKSFLIHRSLSPSKFFLIHCSLIILPFYATQSELLTAPLNNTHSLRSLNWIDGYDIFCSKSLD